MRSEIGVMTPITRIDPIGNKKCGGLRAGPGPLALVAEPAQKIVPPGHTRIIFDALRRTPIDDAQHALALLFLLPAFCFLLSAFSSGQWSMVSGQPRPFSFQLSAF